MSTQPTEHYVTVDQLKNSKWRSKLKQQFENDIWPAECIRCQEIEEIGGDSIRIHSNKIHDTYVNENADYIFVTGLLDNVCNAACATCSPRISSLIGKLRNNIITVNNESLFNSIPIDQILVFEVTGGEPSVSKLYQNSLSSLTSATKYVRINTNGKRFISEIERLLINGVNVTITLSIDGVGDIFEYMRWPIKWSEFENTVLQYKKLASQYDNLKLDFWMTVSSLNVADIANVESYSSAVNIPMSYAVLHEPECLSIKYKNRFTNALRSADSPLADLIGVSDSNEDEINAYIATIDSTRNTDIQNFIKL
tara:strand:- start:106 stop:1035 length:930 start_codon:yes stop_codon:yes gene_type:complete